MRNTKRKAKRIGIACSLLTGATLLAAATACTPIERSLGDLSAGAPGAGSSGAGFAGSSGSSGAAGSSGSSGAAGSSGSSGAAGDSGEITAGTCGDSQLTPCGVRGIEQVGSWDVRATVSYGAPNVVPLAERCAEFSFTLNLSSDRRFLTLAADGNFEQVPAAQQGSDLHLGVDYATLPVGGACPSPTVQLSALNIAFADATSARTQGQLSGSAVGRFDYSGGGDELTSQPVTLTLSGVPDATKPTLLAWDAVRDPFDVVYVYASEALQTNAAFFLGKDHSLPLAIDDLPKLAAAPQATALFAYRSLLPLGGSWPITGTGSDLSGNPVSLPTGRIRTLPDPGVLSQAGFEGDNGGIPSTAALISGHGDVPAITGSQSLWVAQSSRVILHLQRGAGESTLRFSVQPFVPANAPTDLALRFDATLGGAVVGRQAAYAFLTDASAAIVTNDPDWPNAAPVQDVSIPLTGDGPDVLLEINLSKALFGMQIDDVRIE